MASFLDILFAKLEENKVHQSIHTNVFQQNTEPITDNHVAELERYASICNRPATKNISVQKSKRTHGRSNRSMDDK
jgi:hypothetical protein